MSSIRKFKGMFYLSVALIILVGILGYYGIMRSFSTMEEVITSVSRISILSAEIQYQMLLHRRFEKDYLLNIGDETRQRSYVKRFWNVNADLSANIGELKELVSNEERLSDIQLEIMENESSIKDTIYKSYMIGAFEARNHDIRKRIFELDFYYQRYLQGFRSIVERLQGDPTITPADGNRMMLPFKQDIYQLEYAVDDANEASKLLLSILLKKAQTENADNRRLILFVSLISIGSLIAIRYILERSFKMTIDARLEYRKSEHLLQDTLDAIQDGICLVDTKMTILRANAWLERKSGMESGATGKKCKDLFKNPDGSGQTCACDNTLSTGQVSREVNRLKLGNVREGWYEITSYPYNNHRGEIIGALLYIRDVSQQMVAEEEKNSLEAKLRQSQKMEAIGTLAGGIAHDFNNVLTAATGFTELSIESLKLNMPIHSYLEKTLSALNRAKELVKQILTFSRQIDQEKQVVDIEEILNESMKLLRSSIPATIKIKTEVKAQNKTVFADLTQIHQVIMNLATNAYQAMKEKGGQLYINVDNISSDDFSDKLTESARPGNYLRLMFQDTGTGMKKEVIKRIFEPFFTTKEVGEGTGLGLSIVHGIVKQHDGYITVDSAPNKGTVVCIFLPLNTEHVIVAQEEVLNIIPEKGRRILFVDDEVQITEFIKEALSRKGYEVTAFTDSRRALDEFRSHPDDYDVLVSDQTMPGLTGFKIAEQVLRLRPHMPVILCSGYSETLTTEKVSDMGISDYLFKPIKADQLIAAIEEPFRKKIPDQRKVEAG